jgi:hypothetical protein
MRRASHALAAYSIIAVALTWPLARGLTRNVAWDLGDSILNMWILAWDGEQFRAILSGQLDHIRTFFDANIFHPAALTLAYSEHLFPQAVTIFPVYLVTRNPILCYNLLFLSTFILSGLGMYLLVRELTGNATAGFIAGLLFAFAPYRIPQSSHLQVLSSQWMPLAMFGFRRYFVTGRRRTLAAASCAVVVQNLSCGYYLLYFTPFVAAYVVFEAWRSGGGRDRRAWVDLAVAAGVIVVLTTPFVVPYMRVRQELQLSRSLTEVTRLSADVYSYATASEAERFWGSRIADVFRKPEGELFPGVVTVLLAVIGLIWGERDRQRNGRREGMAAVNDGPRWRVWMVPLLVTVIGLHLAAALATILFDDSRSISGSSTFDWAMSHSC